MAQNFPDNPVLNDLVTVNGITYKWNGYAWDVVQDAAEGLTDIVNDTTPQLGGNLDLNSNDITGTGNINITGSITASGELTLPTSGTPSTNEGSITWNGTTDTLTIGTGTESVKILSLVDLSVGAEASASGDGGISYDNATGVFNYTPPDLSSYLTDLSGLSVDSLSDINFNSVVLDDSNGQNKILAWDQTLQAFVPVDSASGGANVTISDDAPVGPSAGDLWWESDVGRLKVYYNDGVTSQWVDASPIGTVAETANSANQIKIEVKNTSGGTLSKGTPVHVTGTVGATDVLEIGPSDASDPATMPAVGLLCEDLANNATGFAAVAGLLLHMTTDVSAISTEDGLDPNEGETLYVKSGGGLTVVKPVGSDLIQNVGKIGKVSGGASGSIVVSCIMRTNDIPNEIVLRGNLDLNNNNITGTGDVNITGTVTANLRTNELGVQIGSLSSTDTYGVSIGRSAVSETYGIAIGMETQADTYDVTIGAFAGKNKQTVANSYTVGIGAFAQQNANPGDETGTGAVAIGVLAGDANQGQNALALGRYAGRNNQASQSIVINATGSDLENTTSNSCVVKPIRNASGTHSLEYDPTSGEITYDTLASGGSSDSIIEGNTSVEVTDTGSDGHIDLTTEGTLRWEITSAGHLLPSTNSDYDIGSAERKVRHLFLSDNSLYFVDSSDVERILNVSNGKMVFDGSNLSDTSSETPADTAAIDLSKTNHFVTPGETYTLGDGSYVGQELSFWRQAGVGYPEITVDNALFTSTGNNTSVVASFTWRLSGDYAGKFSCVWNGSQWCLSSGDTGV